MGPQVVFYQSCRERRVKKENTGLKKRKTLKNLLTNSWNCVKIQFQPSEKLRRAPCKLNNVRQNTKHQKRTLSCPQSKALWGNVYYFFEAND